MNPLKWLEKKTYLGEIIQDYGVLAEYRIGLSKVRVSLLLCRKDGKEQLVIKETAFAYLAASARYTYVDKSQIHDFKTAVDDAYQRMTGQS